MLVKHRREPIITPIDVLMKAIYKDGTVSTLLWKMSGIVGQRYDIDPVDIIILRQNGIEYEKIRDRVEIDMQCGVMTMEEAQHKYPEYYL